MPATTELELRLDAPDPDSTSALGRALARAAQPGDLICLWGDLGAGTTHLAKAFGAGLFHIDLYRLADATDVLAGGLVDDRQSAGVTLVEWPDRMRTALPAARLDVLIDGTGEEPRRITLRAGDPSYRRYLDAAA